MGEVNFEEAVCRMALMQVKGLGLAGCRTLINAMGSAKAVFDYAGDLKSYVHGLSHEILSEICDKKIFDKPKREIDFIVKNGIRILLDNEEDYPSRLRDCKDAPLYVFFKGNANLNSLHVVSIVGTRRSTDYGRNLCRDFVHELYGQCPETVIVSGLAYGIDIEAHRAALADGMCTIGVMAHGLDRIYPLQHRQTAVEMLECGGLLTEYLSGTRPERFNFVQRNRIVAGLCDAVVVVESALHGGALITASLANGYNRECYAFPGRISDACSAGCNNLIAGNNAKLLTSASDFVKDMMWMNTSEMMKPRPVQRQLFVELNDEEKRILYLLRDKGDMQINSLVLEAGIPVNRLVVMMFELEMKGVVQVLAGNVYKAI